MRLFSRKERNVFSEAAGREKQPARLYNCAMGCIIAGTLICDPARAWIPAAALAVCIIVGRLRLQHLYLYLSRIFAYIVSIAAFSKAAEAEQIRNAVPLTLGGHEGVEVIIPFSAFYVSGLTLAMAFMYAFRGRLYRQINRAQKGMAIGAVLTLIVTTWANGAPDIGIAACVAMITAGAALLPEMLRRLPPEE
jgi:hypothetical protein